MKTSVIEVHDMVAPVATATGCHPKPSVQNVNVAGESWI